jgi:L-malate glycosyltransferase
MIVAQMITSFGLGGTERQLVTLLSGLDRARWRPELICFRKVGPFLTDLAAMGVAPQTLPLGGSLMRPNTLSAIARLAHVLRDSQAALVHCHDIYSVLLGVPAARLAGVPVIAARRDLGHHVGRLMRPALRLALQGADCVLANAATVATQLERREGVPAARLAIIPNGIDLPTFDAASRELAAPAPLGEDAGGAVTVLTVARMTYQAKGHTDLIAAAPEVRRAIPTVRFVLAGDGPEEPELRRQAERLGVADAVSFLGRRPDAPALFARADVVCHPSRAEGLPNAVLEAMAAARPIVATTAGGTPELLHDGVHGILVPPADPPRLAAALIQVLGDRGRARALGVAARARVADRFSIRRLVDRTERLYERLTGSRTEAVAPA